MNDIKELTHTLEIIQNKLKQCQQEQCQKLNKMTTKRSLLYESVEVLQNSLNSALKQDLHRKSFQSHINHKPEQELIPIIGDEFIDTTIGPVKDKLKLLTCKGWIRNDKRVWIQAQALCLSNDINQAHLNSIPNNFTETIYINSVEEFKENTIIHFYMTFDVNDDMLDELINMKVTCNIDNEYMNSISSVQWIIDSKDLTWKEQFLLSIPNVIQAYFPCHIKILNYGDNNIIMNSLLKDMICLNNHIYISNDQFYLFDYNNEYINLYGLNQRITTKTASKFNHLSIDVSTTKKELIKSLGEQCVTLEQNQLNQTRLQTAFLLSDITK